MINNESQVYTTNYGYNSEGLKVSEINTLGTDVTNSVYQYWGYTAGKLDYVSKVLKQPVVSLQDSDKEIIYNYDYANSNSLTQPYQISSLDKNNDGSREVQTINYYTSGRIQSKTNSNGSVEYYLYNDADQLTHHCKSDNIQSICTVTTYSEGRKNSVETGAIYNVSRVTDELISIHGLLKEYEYDIYGQILNEYQVIDGARVLLKHYTRGSNQKVIYTSNTMTPRGRARSYMNGFNQVYMVEDAMNNRSHNYYDNHGNMYAMKDKLGNVTLYEYDAQGNLLSKSDPHAVATNPTSPMSETYTYDYNGQMLTQTNLQSEVSTFKYDVLGQVVESEDHLGNITKSLYDANKLRIQVKPNGQVTMYRYNDAEMLDTIIQKKLKISENGIDTTTVQLGDFLTIYTYDTEGNQISVQQGTQGLSLVTTSTSEYDLYNRRIMKQNAEEQAQSIINKYYYNGFGSVDSILKMDVSTIDSTIISGMKYEYNGFGSPANTYSGKWNGSSLQIDWELQRSTVYNDAQEVIETSSPSGGRIIRSLNENRQLVGIQKSDGYSESYTLDANGNILTITQPNKDGTGELITTMTYDSLNRMRTRVDPEGNSTSMQYDLLGRIKLRTDHSSNEVRTQYSDGLLGQRIVETIYPDDTKDTLIYNGSGQLVYQANSSQSSSEFHYNAFGQADSIIYSKAEGVDYLKLMRFDSLRRPHQVLKVLNPGVVDSDTIKVIRTYDLVNRITIETLIDEDGSQFVTNYAYDDIQRQVKVTYPSGKEVIKHFDEVSRLLQIDFEGQSTLTQSYSKGLLKERVRGNGISTIYNFDNSGKLKDMNHLKSSVQVGVNFGYNSMNLLASITRPGAYQSSEVIDYHDDSQIEKLTGTNGDVIDFSYSSNGNFQQRANQTYNSNSMNELVEITDSGNSIFNFEYNDIGSLSSQIESTYDELDQLSSTKTKSITWNAEQFLESVTIEENSVTTQIQYTYDGLNRRIAKSKTIDGGVPEVTKYIYDGWQLIQEESLTETINYVWGNYIDELVYYEVDGTGYYPLQGVNYNIEAVSNEAGAIVEWYQISPFGQVKMFNGLGEDITETGSRVSNRHTFQGRDYDEDLGMFYYRNRWMSPTMGRFISRDPMRYGAGDINLYRFVGNNPFGSLDPSGMSTIVNKTTGKILSVTNDGDLGIYDRCSDGTKALGYTYYWDEFAVPGTEQVAPNAKIKFGNSVDSYITQLNDNVKVQYSTTYEDFKLLAAQSRRGGIYDIKDGLGHYSGYLLDGKYISGRSAGNYLAGLNAATIKPIFVTWSFWRETAFKKAGEAHDPNSNAGPPYYGEIEQTGRWFARGFDEAMNR